MNKAVPFLHFYMKICHNDVEHFRIICTIIHTKRPIQKSPPHRSRCIVFKIVSNDIHAKGHSSAVCLLDDRIVQALPGPRVESIECIPRDPALAAVQELQETIHLLLGRQFRRCHLGDPQLRNAMLCLQILELLDGVLEVIQIRSFAVVVESEDVNGATFALVEEGGQVVETHVGIVEIISDTRRDELDGARRLGLHVGVPVLHTGTNVHLRSAFVGRHIGLVEAHQVGIAGGVLVPERSVRINGA